MKTNVALLKFTIVSLALVGFATAGRAVDFIVKTAQELQNALTLAAANGAHDTIYVTNGYYVGNFSYNSTEDRDLAIVPGVGVKNTEIVIDGAGGGRTLSITSGGSATTVRVQGMTFLRDAGNGSLYALRIDARASGTVTVEGCRFLTPAGKTGAGLEVVAAQNARVTGCTMNGSPGSGTTGCAIYGVGGEVVVQGCVLSSNSSGGLLITQGTSISVTSNSFLGNRNGGAQISGSSGTAVFVAGNTFVGNSEFPGAGAYIANSSGSAIVAGNIFRQNSSGPYQGGGLYFSGHGTAGHTALISNNVFTANTSGGQGGGANINSSGQIVSVVTGNTCADNTARDAGGGIYVSGQPVVTENTFVRNSCTSGSGGGAYFSATSNILSRNTFRLNTAKYNGGAIYASGTDIRLTGNLVVENSQSDTAYSGGGIFVNASATLRLINNTITKNHSAGNGGGVRFEVNGVVEVLNVMNNIIWGNSAAGSGSEVMLTGTGASKEFRFNNAQDGGVGGIWTLFADNIEPAPQFFDPENGDFHIHDTSPCKDAGNDGAPSRPATDLDNEPRIAGSAVDIGAYEFATTAAHPADADANFVLTAAEFNAYASVWKSGQPWVRPPVVIPPDYVTRAGYLMMNQGGAYHNAGSARPVNWKTGP